MRKGGFDTFTLDDYLITKDGRVFNKKWGRFLWLLNLDKKPNDNNNFGYCNV